MTSINCIHFSDIHINEDEPKMDVESVLDHLWKDIRNRASGVDAGLEEIDLVFISGDIAFHGAHAEYSLAEEIFFKPLYDYANIAPEQVFIVPGNHDTKLSVLPKEELDRRLEAIHREEGPSKAFENEEFIKLMVGRFPGYLKFVGRNFKHLNLVDQGLYWSNQVDVSGWQVGIAGLNSAWAAYGGQEDYGKIFLGERQVKSAIDQIEQAQLKISLVHHPFKWFAQNRDSEYCETRIRQDCLIHMHGHIHRTDIEISSTLEGNVVILPAGSIFERRESANSYNYIILNPEEEMARIFLRSYNARGFCWQAYPSSTHGGPQGVHQVPLGSIERSDSITHPGIVAPRTAAHRLESFQDRKDKLIQRITRTAVNPNSMDFGILIGPSNPDVELFPASEKWVKELFRNVPRLKELRTYNEYLLLKYRIPIKDSGLREGYAWPTGHLQGIGEFMLKQDTLDLVDVAATIIEQVLFMHRVMRHIGWKGESSAFIIVRDIDRRELQLFYDGYPRLYNEYALAPDESGIMRQAIGNLGGTDQSAIEMCMNLVGRVAAEFAFHPEPDAKRAILRHATKDVLSFRTKFTANGQVIVPVIPFWELKGHGPEDLRP